VHGEALLRVDRPARVVRSVRALHDVTVTIHFTYAVVLGAP
jgi:hypothetical protein